MPTAAALLRQARTRAHLSQRALARRAGTAQSVIARIERGQTSPTWETLQRLLAALHLEADVRLDPRVVVGSHMLDDVPRILALTPEQRLEEVQNLTEFLHHVRRV
jgi:transcriptional regulator with XRE-family HTH domain